jgi:hypothetical protein
LLDLSELCKRDQPISNGGAKGICLPALWGLVRTSRLFRFWMSAFAIGIATFVTWQSAVPWILRFIEWPFLWFLFTCIYLLLFSIAHPPKPEKFQKKEKHEDFQRLGLTR